MGIYGSVLTHHSRWTGSIPVACCSVLGSINCSDLVRCGYTMCILGHPHRPLQNTHTHTHTHTYTWITDTILFSVSEVTISYPGFGSFTVYYSGSGPIP